MFQFDNCYWSFDGFKIDSQGRTVADRHYPNGGKYCDQVSVKPSKTR